MPIPLSEALRASPETQRGTPAAITSAADNALLANSIRALAMDAVQAANSGHPGMPMGMAELAVALWNRHFRHNPADPHWADRGSGGTFGLSKLIQHVVAAVKRAITQ